MLPDWCVRKLGPFPAVLSQNADKKVVCYVFRVKKIHSELPSDPRGKLDKAKSSYVHYVIRQVELLISKLFQSTVPQSVQSSCVR